MFGLTCLTWASNPKPQRIRWLCQLYNYHCVTKIMKIEIYLKSERNPSQTLQSTTGLRHLPLHATLSDFTLLAISSCQPSYARLTSLVSLTKLIQNEVLPIIRRCLLQNRLCSEACLIWSWYRFLQRRGDSPPGPRAIRTTQSNRHGSGRRQTR